MSQSYPTARQVRRVPVGSTATSVTVTYYNADGTVRDLSAASGAKLFHASTEAGTAVTTDGVAAFVTDGSDGQVSYTLTTTEVASARLLRCEFEVKGVGSNDLISEMFSLLVIERARVA